MTKRRSKKKWMALYLSMQQAADDGTRQCRKYLDQGAKHALESRDRNRGIFVEDHARAHAREAHKFIMKSKRNTRHKKLLHFNRNSYTYGTLKENCYPVPTVLRKNYTRTWLAD